MLHTCVAECAEIEGIWRLWSIFVSLRMCRWWSLSTLYNYIVAPIPDSSYRRWFRSALLCFLAVGHSFFPFFFFFFFFGRALLTYFCLLMTQIIQIIVYTKYFFSLHFPSFFFFTPKYVSPSYNRNGWLGVKHQVTNLLSIPRRENQTATSWASTTSWSRWRCSRTPTRPWTSWCGRPTPWASAPPTAPSPWPGPASTARSTTPSSSTRTRRPTRTGSRLPPPWTSTGKRWISPPPSWSWWACRPTISPSPGPTTSTCWTSWALTRTRRTW